MNFLLPTLIGQLITRSSWSSSTVQRSQWLE